jgi:hypothetical protein
MSKVDHKPTQNERIIEYIKENGGITQFEATAELGVLRLPSRINDLKNLGYPVVDEWVKVKNRFGETCNVKRYRLEGVF